MAHPWCRHSLRNSSHKHHQRTILPVRLPGGGWPTKCHLPPCHPRLQRIVVHERYLSHRLHYPVLAVGPTRPHYHLARIFSRCIHQPTILHRGIAATTVIRRPKQTGPMVAHWSCASRGLAGLIRCLHASRTVLLPDLRVRNVRRIAHPLDQGGLNVRTARLQEPRRQ
jgi:hypothetical protein